MLPRRDPHPACCRGSLGRRAWPRCCVSDSLWNGCPANAHLLLAQAVRGCRGREARTGNPSVARPSSPSRCWRGAPTKTSLAGQAPPWWAGSALQPCLALVARAGLARWAPFTLCALPLIGVFACAPGAGKRRYTSAQICPQPAFVSTCPLPCSPPSCQ